MNLTLLNGIAIFVPTLLVAATTFAQVRPNVEYSADQTMEHAEGAMQGKFYYTPGKERREMNQGGMNMVNITRHDKKVVWVLMPETKTYMEMPMGSQSSPGDLSSYKMENSEVGKETMNGMATTKSKLVMTGQDDTKFGGFMWSTKEGIMVKMDTIAIEKGEKMRMKQELTNIKIGKQDPQLFEIPPGYQRTSMMGMPGIGKHGDDDAGTENDDEGHTNAGEAQTDTSKKPNKPASGLDKLKKILR